MKRSFVVAGLVIAAALASLVTYLLVPTSDSGGGAEGVKKPVLFRTYAPNARSVFVAGSFNAWRTVEYRLEKKDGGFWEATVPIAPGRYEYKFLVDTVWTYDVENPIKVPVPLPYVGYNSVLEVKIGEDSLKNQ